MKYQVKTLEGLDEATQKLYAKDGDVYTLKIEGMPKAEDVAGLKAKVEELLSEKKAEQKARKEAEAQAKKEAEERAKKAGDVDALTKSWEDKLAARETELVAERDQAMALLKNEKIHTRAVELANTLAIPGSADVLLPHIESRISMDIKDGRAVDVVLDAEGKPSALSVEELGKEIAANKAFAPLIVASNAAGGGAKGGAGGNTQKPGGDMGGNKSERVAAISERLAAAQN